MKRLIIATFLAAWFGFPSWGKNTVTKVEQVTTAVTLDADVDYHVTSATPFAEGGSINITNTEHAVVILDALRPSDAKAFLGNITINGQKASDGSNCQLKLYNRGAILLPYTSTQRPLTVFDGPDFSGESYNAFTEGHNGSGWMKNVDTQWNNRIRSFRLKRGYMVTFALGDTGQGYSRCFIAADADLEVNLPALMDRRITSYRLFKWYDTGKKQLANAAGNGDALRLLNVQSSYDWGQGNSSLLPDFEWVANHIYEDWPSASTIGKISQSPHTKNNNEPRNSGDDHPQDLATILGNWENMMRTGLRLCSPASWDGSDYWNATGFLAEFMDSIDARGWRCDIIDLHCYWWPESNFGNVNNWANKYKRPIWISEWCWGASWNNNGSFSGSATEASFRTAIQNITTGLNNNNNVERYYYWDGENGNFPCRLIRDGSLTQAGQYYANMTTPLAYSGGLNYVPTAPRTYAPADLKVSFITSSMNARVAFSLQNGELTDSVAIMRSSNNGKTWEKVKTYSAEEIGSKTNITYSDPVPGGGTYSYQVVDYACTGKVNRTATESLTIGGSEKGLADFQFGTVSSTPGDIVSLLYADGFEEYPVLIGGSPSFANTGTGSNAKGMVNNYISSVKANGLYASATYREHTWEGVNAPREETTHFIVGKPANGTIGTLKYELGFVPKTEGESGYVEGSISYDNAKTLSNRDEDIREVTFRQPFAETPVVMVTPLTLSSAASQQLTMWRIWDVTPEGFKVQLLRQKGNTATNNNLLRVGYLAMEQGQSADGLGHIYTVSTQELDFTSAYKDVEFAYEATNPRLMAQLQTDYQLTARETQTAAILRLYNAKPASVRLYMQIDNTHNAMFINSTRNAVETIGFINISDDPDYNPDGIRDVAPQLQPASTDKVFDLSGRRMNGRQLRPGIYIAGGRKMLVK